MKSAESTDARRGPGPSAQNPIRMSCGGAVYLPHGCNARAFHAKPWARSPVGFVSRRLRSDLHHRSRAPAASKRHAVVVDVLESALTDSDRWKLDRRRSLTHYSRKLGRLKVRPIRILSYPFASVGGCVVFALLHRWRAGADARRFFIPGTGHDSFLPGSVTVHLRLIAAEWNPRFYRRPV